MVKVVGLFIPYHKAIHTCKLPHLMNKINSFNDFNKTTTSFQPDITYYLTIHTAQI